MNQGLFLLVGIKWVNTTNSLSSGSLHFHESETDNGKFISNIYLLDVMLMKKIKQGKAMESDESCYFRKRGREALPDKVTCDQGPGQHRSEGGGTRHMAIAEVCSR